MKPNTYNAWAVCVDGVPALHRKLASSAYRLRRELETIPGMGELTIQPITITTGAKGVHCYVTT